MHNTRGLSTDHATTTDSERNGSSAEVGRRREIDIQEQIYEDTGELNSDNDEPGPLVRELISKAHEIGDLQELWENDSKYKRLFEILRNLVDKNFHEKVIVFSYFRPTLDYLHERLHQDGIRSIVLKGGLTIDKSEVLEKIKSFGAQNVLLSSEVGSEGIDLQITTMRY